MASPLQWNYRPKPEDGVRDSKGYMHEPKREHDESSWSRRKVKQLAEANEKVAENQRRMGYQVYEGDPGKPPYQMSHHEQIEASKPLYQSICNIL